MFLKKFFSTEYATGTFKTILNLPKQHDTKSCHASGSREESEQTRSSIALLESPKGDSAAIIEIEEEENVEDQPMSPSHQFLEMWLPGRILHVTPRSLETRLDEQVM